MSCGELFTLECSPGTFSVKGLSNCGDLLVHSSVQRFIIYKHEYIKNRIKIYKKKIKNNDIPTKKNLGWELCTYVCATPVIYSIQYNTIQCNKYNTKLYCDILFYGYNKYDIQNTWHCQYDNFFSERART